jgi:hypothetical protein
VTTSADRLLLRWVPLAAFLAVVMAVSLTVGPQPFGFHGWPKAPAPRSIDRVVRVEPTNARVAIAESEPAAPAKPRSKAATPGRPSTEPGPAGRHAVPVPYTPRHPARHRPRGSGGQDRPPSPAESPAPRPDASDPAGQTPDGTPVAQAPRPLPKGAEAKLQVRPARPHVTVDVELRLGRGHGHGHAYGHRRH